MVLHSNSNPTERREITALPFEVKTGFTAIPNAVITHYSFFPKFNGNVFRVYSYLLKMYNDKYGYAFPTQDQGAKELGIADNTFANSIKVLVDAELIRPEKNRPFNNLVYYFNTPIEDEAEFFAKFPQAAEVKRKKNATWSKIAPVREASKERLTHDDMDDWL